MANDKLYSETDIQGIADSIRGKNGSTTKYKVSEMSAAIDALDTSGGAVESVDGQTGAVVTNAVKYTAQTLTTAQQVQVQTNIGVKDTVQGLDSVLSGTTIVPKASQAQYDTSGNSIAEQFGKIVSGETTVGLATVATTATMSMNDGDGNDIVSTYATKTELNGKASSTYYSEGTITSEDYSPIHVQLISSDMDITLGPVVAPYQHGSNSRPSISTYIGDSGNWWDYIYAGAVQVRDPVGQTFNPAVVYQGESDALSTSYATGSIKKSLTNNGYYIKKNSGWDPLAGEDWIIEQTKTTSSTLNTYCVKYYSGVMIQDYKIIVGTLASSKWATWNNVLQYYSNPAITWTTPFVITPVVTGSVHSTNGAVMFGGARPTQTSSGVLMLISAVAKENTGVQIDLHVVGRWK